jgi:hypothetical protein
VERLEVGLVVQVLVVDDDARTDGYQDDSAQLRTQSAAQPRRLVDVIVAHWAALLLLRAF